MEELLPCCVIQEIMLYCHKHPRLTLVCKEWRNLFVQAMIQHKNYIYAMRYNPGYLDHLTEKKINDPEFLVALYLHASEEDQLKFYDRFKFIEFNDDPIAVEFRARFPAFTKSYMHILFEMLVFMKCLMCRRFDLVSSILRRTGEYSAAVFFAHKVIGDRGIFYLPPWPMVEVYRELVNFCNRWEHTPYLVSNSMIRTIMLMNDEMKTFIRDNNWSYHRIFMN